MPNDETVYEFAEGHADDIFEMAESGEYNGLCVICGETTYGNVDPDSRGDRCEACGEPGVYGAQELMLYAFA